MVIGLMVAGLIFFLLFSLVGHFRRVMHGRERLMDGFYWTCLGCVLLVLGLVTWGGCCIPGLPRLWKFALPSVAFAVACALLAHTLWCRTQARRLSGDPDALKRLSQRLWMPVLGLPLFLLGGIAVTGAVLSRLPVTRTHSFRFTVASGTGDVWINGSRVGQAPLTLTLDQMEGRSLPALGPAQWPPPPPGGWGTSSSSSSSGTYRFDMEMHIPPPGTQGSDTLLFLREADGKRVMTCGLGIRVTGDKGEAFQFIGSDGRSVGSPGRSDSAHTFNWGRPGDAPLRAEP